MTQSNRTPLKQNNRVGQFLTAPKTPAPSYLDVVEEDRIDWERKQKGKKSDVIEEPEDDLPEDEVVEAVVRPPKAKKQHKKKHREIIYDDERDQMIVKRKRRRQADYFYADDFE